MAFQLTDAVLTFVILVAMVVLAPIIFEFTAMIQTEADPLSSMILSLVVPLFIVALVISAGVSARRRV